MKIYDCFMFFDEEMLLDLRLNIMDKYVDKFVITEATYMHSGKPKKLIFDINKFSKFKDKIIYNIVDDLPPNIETIYESDNDDVDTRGQKLVRNSSRREHYQREMAQKSLNEAEPDDLILINDVDEIPNLKDINLKKIKEKLIIFKQKIFFYKFNLLYEGMSWYGSRACRKKNFISPQWLRNIKTKRRPIWKFYKPKEPQLIFDGGWHFSFLKKPKDIAIKIKSYSHQEFYKDKFIDEEKIAQRIKNKQDIFDRNIKYEKIKIDESFPKYIVNNKEKFKEWII